MDSLHQKLSLHTSKDTDRLLGEPLVSIFCFCKDRASTIKRCIDSVLNQSYKNIEFVIQDGASTDGTLDIIRSYSDQRIKLVSEKDSGPAQGFWKAINRCSGDIIGSCLTDEELLPDAVATAVAHFRSQPWLSAITFDGFVTNSGGDVIDEFNAGDFNLVDYLFGRYCPLWVASFFRREALLEVGLGKPGWTLGCLEFEIWCRLASQQEIKHYPIRVAHYGVSSSQLSNKPEAFWEHFESRAQVIRKMFSADGFFGENATLLRGCLYNQLYLLYNHVRAYKLKTHAELLAKRLCEIIDSMSLLEQVRHLEYFPTVGVNSTGRFSSFRFFAVVDRLWLKIALQIPAKTRRRIPRRVKDTVRAIFAAALLAPVNARSFLSFVVSAIRRRISASVGRGELPRPSISPKLYHEVAQLHYARGQVAQALELWWAARKLNSATIDGLACQARLMLHSSSNEALLTAQQDWAKRHTRPVTRVPELYRRSNDTGRIRVGYYCSFLDSDTIRYQLVPFLRYRDRSQFEVFGYSSTPVSPDIGGAFDHLRVTGAMSDEAFVRAVRADKIDIFVELTGFSPQNRFAAMAKRCAPVQVSYLNHTGTSGVANVDYVLADATGVLPQEDRFYTERVYRLPGSFFCFDYSGSDLPPVALPPSVRNGYATFCCFGSGGKLNRYLIEIWSRILRRLPGSVLYIRNNQTSHPDNRRFLQDQFAWHGVPAECLRIVGGTDRYNILKCYEEADISLDTWPYCGGNTIAEAIWQGVPVVTMKGNRFSSRYGASLVMAAGCPELVAATPDEYVRIAVDLANNPGRLASYRENLRSMAKKHGLSDPQKFARNLETAYLEMWSTAAASPARLPSYA